MASNEKSVPRILQPQPKSDSDPGQQGGLNEQQAKPGADKGDQQMGEGSYEATRDYQKNIEDYLKKGHVEEDAKAAKPKSEQEARDLEQAEKQGRSHSKGER